MKSFRELRVWQKAMDLVERVYVLTGKFPREETYAYRANSPSRDINTFEYRRRPHT
jgi:hypothetical protein